MSPIALTETDHRVPAKLAPWVEPPVTAENLPWADLESIDLRLLDRQDPAVRAQLVASAKKALTVDGFLFVTGTGVTDETLRRNLAIAQYAISGIPSGDKAPFAAKLEDGSYKGYKLRGICKKEGGVPDNLEHYNLESSSFESPEGQHPPQLLPYLPEIRAFAEHTYYHTGALGAACQRFMGYFPRTKEDEAATEGIWSKGHTDYNSISLLYSQPITALQILTNDDEWRWVKHVQGAVVVNTADALQFLTCGLFKATRHRVMRPPNDQADIIRYILMYFARVHRDLPLNPIWDSPLVAKLGKNAFQDRIDAGGQAPTQDEWLRERIKRTGNELYDQTRSRRTARWWRTSWVTK
ncbi:Clavaminate synthase-like protein [Dioszegia hungarica]|uniref:Clavaminate synthase-like protein n=1 Tax=Dioszegia hungarica TaxID=4972 RepID=A0AA38LS57_9TREE|nr:Clavaminate synthase-like protein [Dioszegia hungarica]KAI9633810.1 Clavaminate synthase-like protein [Dioszegia hungarica]